MKQIILEVPDAIPDDQYSREFLQGMVNRMSQGFFTYGPIRDFYPDSKDAMKNLQVRIKKYKSEGNTEWLLDAANFAMIEYMHPKHKKAHFRATSASESPGTWHQEED